MSRPSQVAFVVTLAASIGLVSLGEAGPTDAQKCQAAKLKESANYSSCRLKAESKAVKKGLSPDYTRCDQKMDKKWPKIELKYGGECPTSGDQAAIQADLTTCADEVAATLACSGAFVGDACFFLSAPGTSCDDACGAQGLTYDASGTSYSFFSVANCDEVLDALGAGGAPAIDVLCFDLLGCFESGGSRANCGASDPAVSSPGVVRACACS